MNIVYKPTPNLCFKCLRIGECFETHSGVVYIKIDDKYAIDLSNGQKCVMDHEGFVLSAPDIRIINSDPTLPSVATSD